VERAGVGLVAAELVVEVLAGVGPVAEEERRPLPRLLLAVAVSPVAVLEELEKTDFSFPSTRILTSTALERTATRLCLCHRLKAMMMSFARAMVGFMAWERISNSV